MSQVHVQMTLNRFLINETTSEGNNLRINAPVHPAKRHAVQQKDLKLLNLTLIKADLAAAMILTVSGAVSVENL